MLKPSRLYPSGRVCRELKKKKEMKHMGKWSIVFQKFKTHDKIVSIQILSTTPKKLLGVSTKSQKWVIYIKKKLQGQKSAQGYPRYTHFCYISSQIWWKVILLRRYQIAKTDTDETCCVGANRRWILTKQVSFSISNSTGQTFNHPQLHMLLSLRDNSLKKWIFATF